MAVSFIGRENRRKPAASHLQTLSHNIVSNTTIDMRLSQSQIQCTYVL